MGLTEPGTEIAAIAAEVLRDVARLQAVADAHATGESSRLAIVTSRHSAHHLLGNALMECRTVLRGIEVKVCEEDPAHAVEMLLDGEAQMGVLVEPKEPHPGLWYAPVESWGLVLVVPDDHPLTRMPEVTLAALACFPVCTYEAASASRAVVDATFAASDFESSVAFSFGSTGLILEFVERGVAVGLLGAAGFDPQAHPRLRALAVDHLFRPLITHLVLPRRGRLAEFVYRFAGLLVPGVSRGAVQSGA